jgi:hypothetical protein
MSVSPRGSTVTPGTSAPRPSRSRTATGRDRLAEPEHELGRGLVEALAVPGPRLDEDGVRRNRKGREGEQP